MAELALKLFYFPARARGESLRMILKHHKIPFEDVLVSGETFMKMKEEKKLPLGQLPILEVKGKIYPESGSILRFVGQLTETIPQDPVQLLRNDSVLEAVRGLSYIDPVVNRFEGDALQKAFESLLQKVPLTMAYLSESLGKDAFYGVDKPSYADFGVWHYLDNMNTVSPDLIEFDNLKEWMKRLAALPGVAEYLASRPSISDIRKQKLIALF